MSKANSFKNAWTFKSMLVSSNNAFGLDWKFVKILVWASTYEGRTRLTYEKGNIPWRVWSWHVYINNNMWMNIIHWKMWIEFKIGLVTIYSQSNHFFCFLFGRGIQIKTITWQFNIVGFRFLHQWKEGLAKRNLIHLKCKNKSSSGFVGMNNVTYHQT